MIEDENMQQYIRRAIDARSRETGNYLQLPFIATRLGFVLRPYLSRILFGNSGDKSQKDYIKVARDILGVRLKKEQTDTPKDILAYLREAQDPETGERFSNEELLAETRVLLGAGAKIFLP